MSKLIIVESPSKAKTISKILGKNFEVISSRGHLVDLPKNTLGIDENLDAKYVVDKTKEKIVKEIKDRVKSSSLVLLASDPDREGEAISYHIANLLGINGKIRIEFNEITPKAIMASLEKARDIDMNKVNAQQTRRLLDRLVGYQISPLLWKKLGYGTSAGRVQSVALKLICELEDEIKKFIPETYFDISGIFESLALSLFKIDSEKIDKVKDEAIVKRIEALAKSKFKIIKNEIKQKKSVPPLPFKTSSLQQTASTELGFSPSRTMKLAQDLYSGVEIDGSLKGLITYIRTDSTRISDDAKKAAYGHILKLYGKEYHQNRAAKKDKKAQDAHEAIRPTNIALTPASIERFVKKEHFKLYTLIYKRFLASQMSDMVYNQLDLVVENKGIEFRALFNKIAFDGYTKVLERGADFVEEFPKVNKELTLDEIEAKESVTKPPARFSEAALIKKLESEGIGRPSTYANIVETLKTREYVALEEKRFIPTNLGYILKDILDKHFPNIMNTKFTSIMEDNLDEVENGTQDWKSILRTFNKELEDYIVKYKESLKKEEAQKIETDVLCTECKEPMLLKRGRFGPYLECENQHKKSVKDDLIDFHEEKEGFVNMAKELSVAEKKQAGYDTDVVIEGKKAILKEGPYGKYLEVEVDGKKIRKSLPKNIKLDLNKKVLEINEALQTIENEQKRLEKQADPCEKCGSKMVIKQGKWGPFLSCSNYPKCKNIRKITKK